MTITYQLQPRDLRAFYRYAHRHVPVPRWPAYLFYGALVAPCLWLGSLLENVEFAHRILILAMLLLAWRTGWRLFARVLTWYFSERRAYTRGPCRTVYCEHTMTLADDALIEVTPFKESRHLWAGIQQVAEASDYIYLFDRPRSAHVIPKRAFTDAESARRFYDRAVRLQLEAQRTAL